MDDLTFFEKKTSKCLEQHNCFQISLPNMGSLHDIVANVLDYNIVVNKFKLIALLCSLSD